MGAAIDFANVAHNSTGATTNSISTTCTLPGTDNHLEVSAAIDQSAAATATSITVNGVTITPVPSGDKNNTQQDVTWWYMNNPPTGILLTIVATYAANFNTAAITAIPMSGIDTSRAPSAGAGTQGVPSAAIACSTPAAGANDIQFAATMNRGTTQTPGGAPQANVIAPLNSINGPTSYACSYIPGPNAGNFTWNITSGNWSSIGLTVFGLAASGGGVSGAGVSAGAGLSGAGLSGAGMSRSVNL